jgi:hypothetical protein
MTDEASAASEDDGLTMGTVNEGGEFVADEEGSGLEQDDASQVSDEDGVAPEKRHLAVPTNFQVSQVLQGNGEEIAAVYGHPLGMRCMTAVRWAG